VNICGAFTEALGVGYFFDIHSIPNFPAQPAILHFIINKPWHVARHITTAVYSSWSWVRAIYLFINLYV
jgi:hypothetical protein